MIPHQPTAYAACSRLTHMSDPTSLRHFVRESDTDSLDGLELSRRSPLCVVAAFGVCGCSSCGAATITRYPPGP